MSRVARFKKDIKNFDFSSMGKFWQLYVVLGIILLPILLFVLSTGFRKFIISIIASLVEKFILSNLLIANLIFILVVVLLIILAIFIFKKL